MSQKILRPVLIAAALTLTAPVLADDRSEPARSSNAGLGRSDQASPSEGRNESADKHFWVEIAAGNKAEIELGKLALQKSSDPEVKAFAQRMIDEHSAKEREFLTLAKQNDIALPGQTRLSPKHEKVKAKLSGLSGDAFDRAYQEKMVSAHQEMATLLEQTRTKAKNPDLRSFAQNTLPAVRQHEQHASTLDVGAAAVARDDRD